MINQSLQSVAGEGGLFSKTAFDLQARTYLSAVAGSVPVLAPTTPSWTLGAPVMSTASPARHTVGREEEDGSDEA